MNQQASETDEKRLSNSAVNADYSSDKRGSRRAYLDEEIEEKQNYVDFFQLLKAMEKSIVWIILAAIFFGGAAFGYTRFFCTRQYKSKSVIYLVSASKSVLNLSDLQLSSGITDDYAALVKSRSVLITVADNLKLDYSYSQMSAIVSVENPKNTHIMNIYATCSDPLLAQQIADETADIANRKISEVMEIPTPNIIDKAVLPTVPSSPNVSLNVMIGILIGICFIVVITTIRVTLDRTLKSSEDVERYCGLVTLTRVANMNRKKKKGYGGYYGSNSNSGAKIAEPKKSKSKKEAVKR